MQWCAGHVSSHSTRHIWVNLMGVRAQGVQGSYSDMGGVSHNLPIKDGGQWDDRRKIATDASDKSSHLLCHLGAVSTGGAQTNVAKSLNIKVIQITGYSYQITLNVWDICIRLYNCLTITICDTNWQAGVLNQQLPMNAAVSHISGCADFIVYYHLLWVASN